MIVVSINGRLVKKTPSRHYWIFDGTKWQRLGLKKIAELLHVDGSVIKAAIDAAENGCTTAEKTVKPVFDNIAESALMIFFVIISAAIMGLAYATDDTTLGALDIAMCLSVGLVLKEGEVIYYEKV